MTAMHLAMLHSQMHFLSLLETFTHFIKIPYVKVSNR